jgi:murein DD-endopeptidase MepM/ murein hydrolase activator NlpD
MHMTRYIVKVGQHVKAGDIIGYVGSTGGSTGNHLHLGIAKNGTYVNPRLYFDF